MNTEYSMHVNLPEKRYYKIGEVAQAFEVNTSLVRFWEKEFDIIKPKKNAKGKRLFTQEDIKTVKAEKETVIKCARENRLVEEIGR